MRNKAEQRSNRAAPEPAGLRPGLKWGVGVALLLCGMALAWHFYGPQSGRVEPGESIASGEAEARSPQASSSAAASRPGPGQARTSTEPVAGRDSSPQAERGAELGPVDPALARLVGGLRRLGGTDAVLNAETVALWKTNFAQIVQSGPAAVPALRALLNEKTDTAFSRETAQALGYGSARLAAIDALRQIGGAEALSVMENELTRNVNPREVAVLARNLEEAQPGQFREQALSAARAGLQAALSSRDPQMDVAPLFEVFQHYGDASVVPDLERAMAQWKYYATITLADLPNEAGVPSILRMAAENSGHQVVALEMVAQLAPNHPAIYEFLKGQISGNKIPASLWPYLAGPLAGDQYFPVDSAITTYPQIGSTGDIKTTRINAGNQNLYMLPGYLGLTPEELSARTRVVEELLKITNDPAGVAVLQRVRDTLAQRSSRSASVGQPGSGAGL